MKAIIYAAIVSFAFMFAPTRGLARDTILLNGSIGIPAGNHWRIQFEVKNGNRIQGWFRVAKYDIECLIMDQNNYELYEKGYDPFVLYSSGKATAANINVRPRPGIYYLVFSNKHAILYSKTVNGLIVLRD